MTVPLPSSLLPQRIGTGALALAASANAAARRSRTHDGRVVECVAAPGFGVACDAEAVQAPAADAIARALGTRRLEALVEWTRIEVVAKLTRRSALHVFRQRLAHGALQLGACTIRTSLVGDVVVSVGWLEEPQAQRDVA